MFYRIAGDAVRHRSDHYIGLTLAEVVADIAEAYPFSLIRVYAAARIGAPVIPVAVVDHGHYQPSFGPSLHTLNSVL